MENTNELNEGMVPDGDMGSDEVLVKKKKEESAYSDYRCFACNNNRFHLFLYILGRYRQCKF